MSNNLLYLDTNILRFISERKDKWDIFNKYIRDNDYVLVLSLIQVIEIYKVPESQVSISKLLLSIPSAFLKWWRPILLEETGLYPNIEAVDVIVRPYIYEQIKDRNENDLLALLRAYDIDATWLQLQNKAYEYLD